MREEPEPDSSDAARNTPTPTHEPRSTVILPPAIPTVIPLTAGPASRSPPRSELQVLLGLQPELEAKLSSKLLRVAGANAEAGAKAQAGAVGFAGDGSDGAVASLRGTAARTGTGTIEVAVWSRAAIGNYFWSEVFGQTVGAQDGGTLTSTGQFVLGRVRVRYITGYGVQINAMPTAETKLLVLILNTHTPSRVQQGVQWLEAVRTRFTNVQHLGLIVHGQESCRNHWLRPYLDDPRYRIRFAFVTYATDLIDDSRVFQWPLGVATYRGFPTSLTSSLGQTDRAHIARDPKSARCNFFGTVYANSSRVELLRTLRGLPADLGCEIGARMQWAPKETDATLGRYVDTLRRSDLTLSPAGVNSECYRWLEAASQGSTPVVEDVVKPATCGDPLTLMRRMDAPFVYVRNWSSELAPLLVSRSKVAGVSNGSNVIIGGGGGGGAVARGAGDRRRAVRQWYLDFNRAMRVRFLSQLAATFLELAP